MPCLQSIGISACLPLCCLSILRSISAPSHRNFHSLRFRTAVVGFSPQAVPNHFSLMFSSIVSTCFTCASFLMSSFLTWSNLVFPLAYLNSLISAEFSLFSSFFFTAQHSEPYVNAGMMIVLKTVSFNSTGIFLSHITPDTSFHFIRPISIILLTSACEPTSLVNSDPRYLKDVTVDSSASTLFTVGSVSFVGLGKYYTGFCSTDLQPVPLRHNFSCFQVFLHFLTSHSTQHQVVREHHRTGWILSLCFQLESPLL